MKEEITNIITTFEAVGPILGNALKSGQLFNPQCKHTEPDANILCEYDEKVPVVVCAHPYKNQLTLTLKKTLLGGPPQQYRMIPQTGGKLFLQIGKLEIAGS